MPKARLWSGDQVEKPAVMEEIYALEKERDRLKVDFGSAEAQKALREKASQEKL